MSRRWVGSGLAAEAKAKAKAIVTRQCVSSLRQQRPGPLSRDEQTRHVSSRAGEGQTNEEAANTRAGGRRRQRVREGGATTATTATGARTTTTAKARDGVPDLQFPTRTHATEHTGGQQPQSVPQPAPRPRPRPRYDPRLELANYRGSLSHPEIRGVLQGLISLETARVLRLENLMGLLNNVEQVTKQLQAEDMAGDPADLQARMATFLTARQQIVEQWKLERQQQQDYSTAQHGIDGYEHDSENTSMVHPAHVPGRRMGPASDENQRQELDRLVQQQTASFQVMLLPTTAGMWTERGTRSRRSRTDTGTGAGTDTRKQARWYSTQSAPAPVPASASTLQRTMSRAVPAPAPRPVPGPRFFSTTPMPSFRSTASRQSAKPQPDPSAESSGPRSRSRSRSVPNSQTRTRPASTTNPDDGPKQKKESKETAPAWAVQKRALAAKFGASGGWAPRRKLSPDAILHLRALHASNPQLYTTPLLASTFKQSPEAIRRILKSRWMSELASPETIQARRERWARRHDRIWDVKSELGLRPKRTSARKVEDASEAADRLEHEAWARRVLQSAREQNQDQGPGQGQSG